ncbi:YrdB family protein [Peribacillus simplex]|uniref:YrdB family protein n=1 Tax=Peribacillus simplex TaxID=1478 RepID=UPI003D2C189B
MIWWKVKMGFLAVLQMVNLSLRFSLEIFALAVYGHCGFKVGNAGIMKGILSIVIPLGIAVLWGLFGSPRPVYNYQRNFISCWRQLFSWFQ